jgi:hypothetical protein
MANRFPLVLDADAGNKIKELPSGDNLNLRESSIVNVQDINALGTINAADITVNGNRLVAQTFADLTDTPNSFAGAADYFVKVKEDGTGLEFRPFSDIGNIEVERIEASEIILPTADNTVDIGSDALSFRRVTATEFKGDLLTNNETKVFDSVTGFISYAALQGAPQFLSEFTDDIGFLRTNDLDDALAGLFDQGIPFATDIKGSVFADDSTMIIDGVAGVVRGDTEYTGTGFIRGQTVVILADGYVQLGQTEILTTIEPETDGTGSVGTDTRRFGSGYFDTINVPVVETESVQTGLGTGIGIISSSTDISIAAGNRVRIEGNVPFRFASTTADLQLAIGAQEGDVIYNTTTSRLQMYQGGAWKDVNGNVEATTGTSNFNDIIIAGNLTINGTTTTVNTTNTTISDNVIVLNQGELGTGVTLGTSGIEIERGSLANVTFVWNETVDKWTVGSQTLVAATFEGNLTGDVDGNLIGDNISIGRVSVGETDIYGNVEFNNGTTAFQPGNSVDFNCPVDFTNATIIGFAGNVVGDVVGSVFGDDSTLLVDGVNGSIVGPVETTRLRTSETSIALGQNAGLELQSVSAVAIGSVAGLTNQGASAVGVGYSAGGINQGTSAVAVGAYAGGLSQGNYSIAIGDNAGYASQGANSIAIGDRAGQYAQGANSIAIGNNTNSVANSIILNASGSSLSSNAAGFFVDPVRNMASTNVAMYNPTTGELTHTATPGTIAANIDQATLSIGATTATTIAIGRAGSTTTINGTVNLSALVAGSITADDSISITTATGDGNAISIGPAGTNTFVNLTADNIRFFGPITANINAVAGITGDLVGSVFGDDSTLLVDAVNSVIPYSVLDGAPTALSDLSNDLDYTAIVGTAIQNNGLPVDTFMTGNLDAQGNDIVDANLVNATGNLTGDVKGSVFADDSSVMVDAVNFAMFSDVLTLTPLNAEPENFVAGTLAAADGVNWDPASKVGAVPYPVFYDGVAWNALY